MAEIFNADYLFKYFVLLNIALYIQVGAIPATLLQISQDFDMSGAKQGLLGGIVYLSLSIGSPIAGYYFKNYEPKYVLSIVLLINSSFVLLLAFFSEETIYSAYIFIFLRSCVGFTQSFISVFSPIWADEFAPDSKRTIWMSLLQAAIPIGVIIGYISGALALWYSNNYTNMCYIVICWRTPFVLQFILTFPICLVILFVRKEHLNIYNHSTFNSITQSPIILYHTASPISINKNNNISPNRNRTISSYSDNFTHSNDVDNKIFNRKHSLSASFYAPISSEASHLILSDSNALADNNTIPTDSINNNNNTTNEQLTPKISYTKALNMLFNISLYKYMLYTLSATYFVVTGVQFWGTSYMIRCLHADQYIVNCLYVIITSTAPIFGVFYGGWLIDKYGGYRGDAQRTFTLKMCLLLGIFSFIFSVLCSNSSDIYYSSCYLWFLLFFGASILPACTGIMVSIAPNETRFISLSISVVFCNIFGYCLSLILSGYVMEYTENNIENCDSVCALQYGFKFVLYWSFWAFVALLISYCIASKQSSKSVPIIFPKIRSRKTQYESLPGSIHGSPG